MVQKCFAEIEKRCDKIEKTFKREKEVTYKYIEARATQGGTIFKFKFSEDLSEIVEVKQGIWGESGGIERYEIYISHPFYLKDESTLIYLNTRNSMNSKEVNQRLFSIDKSTFEINIVASQRYIPPEESFNFATWISKEAYENDLVS